MVRLWASRARSRALRVRSLCSRAEATTSSRLKFVEFYFGVVASSDFGDETIEPVDKPVKGGVLPAAPNQCACLGVGERQ